MQEIIQQRDLQQQTTTSTIISALKNQNNLISPEKQQEKFDIQISNQQSPSKNQTQQSNVNPNSKSTTLELLAKQDLYLQQDKYVNKNIIIQIKGSQQKGGTFAKFTVYIIKGEDQKGQFQIFRRFNQFYALRSALYLRWPGCFIPGLPEKTLDKNSQDVIAQRQRLLDDFLKKIGSAKHLYYSDQFQLFIRSNTSDLTEHFQKMNILPIDQIVNRYKQTFDDLSGKLVNSQVSIKISSFKTSLKKLQQLLPQLQQTAIMLAQSKQRFNQKLPKLFGIINRYQKNTILQYSQNNNKDLVFLKQENSEQLLVHEQTLKNVTRNNPYRLMEDLIKIQTKDCDSFIKSIESLDQLNEDRLAVQIQIKNYETQIQQLALGKNTFTSMTTRKTKQEVKRQLEQKNKHAIVFKHHLIQLTDMISALIAYIQIDRYKRMKKKYYSNLMKRLVGSESYLIINLCRFWNDIEKNTNKDRVVNTQIQKKQIKSQIEQKQIQQIKK